MSGRSFRSNVPPVTEHREEHLELCAAYAVGNIDPADRQKLIEHLGQGCDACEA